MGASLLKTRTVLTLKEDTPTRTWFESHVDEEGERFHMVGLDPKIWADLDKPTTITVTVEPGDKLNG